MFYCIYSNQELDEKPSPEHVIPLSLGGCNEFVIDVGEKINNEYGSKIEGAFDKDMLAGFLRLKKSNVGHSGKAPSLSMKGFNDGEPITLTIKGINNFSIYDHKQKKEIPIGSLSDLKGKIDINAWIRLIAKITLATGYFIFEKNFNECADCDSLRIITNSAIDGTSFFDSNLDVRTHIYFDSRLNDNHLDFIKEVIKKSNASGVIFEFVENRLHSFIGINGEYIGMINIKCDNEKLLQGEDFYRLSLFCIDGHLEKIGNRKSDINSSNLEE